MSSANTASHGVEKTRPRIGKYIITGRIGKGGMGMVYRGHDEGLDRDVAVKTLTIQGNLEDESRQRFQIEAKAAAKLQHPNIVTVFELDEDRGMPYIAMELLPGWDLEALLRSGETLLLPEKLDVIIQVCRGLQFAHEHHVVHRDIKPSNIRILDDGAVKIMDFGIAKLANTHGVTRTGMMVGTVHYMCPEAIQGQPVDGRSDVFSVGVILSELLGGRRPFEGEGATEVLYKIVQESFPPLPDSGPLTAELQDITGRALAKIPAERYPSAAHLADDLAELRQRVEATIGGVTTDVMESILAARQLVRQGRVDEGVTRLREMVEKTPGSVEARRALRAACREAARKDKPVEAEPDFPELTYQIGATRMQETTLLAEPKGNTAQREAAATGRTLLITGAFVLAFAVVIGLVLLLRNPAPDKPQGHNNAGQATDVPPVVTPGPQVPPATPGGHVPGPVVKMVALKLASEPAGATVTVDGAAAEGRTPLTLSVESGKTHQVAFSLDGYQTRRVPVASGASPDIKVVLAPLGPPGSLTIASSYPVDVTVGGRVLAKGETSPTVVLPGGRHSVVVTAPSVFLRTTREVEVPGGGKARLDLPGVGDLNIQANPDNCEIFVDGMFVDYPPIHHKAVAAGHHTVSFKWKDGGRNEQAIDVESGKPVFVTGQKE
jgi:predicted Ser/Thr protein kinase